jgi:hypothetical protein
MRRAIQLTLTLALTVGLASAALARGRWNDDSDTDGKPKTHPEAAVPEPTAALLFAAGLLAVRRATRRP